MDQSKKTMRHFYCRDVLWETFEAMANDFDCSIDYLVNESMRLYARSKNYQVPAGGASPSQIMPASPPGTSPRASIGTSPSTAVRATGSGIQPARPSTSPMIPAVRPATSTLPPAQTQPRVTPAQQRGLPSQPRPTPSSITGPGITAPISNAAGSASGPPASSVWTPPIATPQSPTPASEPPAPPLFLIYAGQRYSVDKEQFVIGRGSKTADLPIKDGNISRKHAVVLRRNGVYYIKDLGSTNGIEYKGMRIDNKRIDEGDVFFICDYELRFTYQP
jgi:hypothetical protein